MVKYISAKNIKYAIRKGYLNAGEVKNGKVCSSTVNNEIVNILKKTIQTVGKNNLKKTVKLDDTLCIIQSIAWVVELVFLVILQLVQLHKSKFHTKHTSECLPISASEHLAV